jgi:hypothetical protein
LEKFFYRETKAVRNNIALELREMLGWKLDGNGSGSYPEATDGFFY